MHPTLKAKTATVFEYSDLEKFVKEVYGVEVKILTDLISFERVGHYTYHHFSISEEYGALEDIDDDEILARWIETGTYEVIKGTFEDYTELDTRHIMHRLFLDGHIEAGEYYMLVDW